MKKLTIQFAGYGIQHESAIHGCETSAELLGRVAANDLQYEGIPLFDYETGTLWQVVDEKEENKRIAALVAENEELKINNIDIFEDNKKLEAENERLKELLDQIERGEK